MTVVAQFDPHAEGDGAPSTIRVVVCGEVNSGKSTLINALLRGRVLPDLFGTKARPFIHVRPGDRAQTQACYADGSETSCDELTSEVLREAASCNITRDAAHLAGLEIIEMPYLNERDITDEQIAFVESADVLVWMTIASQAWRLSEKTILDRCEKRPKAAVLVVSRADKLRSDDDRAKLLGRLERETEDYFRSIVLLRGKDTTIDAAGSDDEAWNLTAAPELAAHLGRLAAEVRTSKVAAVAALEDLVNSADDEEDMSGEIGMGSADIVPINAAASDWVEDTSAGATIVVDDVAEEPETREPETAVAPARPPMAHPAQIEASSDEVALPEGAVLSTSAQAAMTALLPALHGCDAVGVVALDDAAQLQFLKGSDADWPAIGSACHSLVSAGLKLDTTVQNEPFAAHIALRGHHFILQTSPRKKAILFMLAPVARMNHGIARTAFTRLARSLEQSR